MANYTVTTDFLAKDALASGNPSKIIKGTEFDVEFDAIAVAIATKADAANPTFTGTVTTPLTASRAVVTGASSELSASAVTATELGYVSGVTSAIQTQLNTKAPTASPTFTGTLTAAAISATSMASSGAVSGTTGTFSGAVSGTTGTFTGALNVGGATSITSNLDVSVTGQTSYSTAAIEAISASGDVYIGMHAAGSSAFAWKHARGVDGVYAVTSTGAAANITAADFIISSDARLKSDVRVLTDSGEMIDALTGYRFKYTDTGVARIGLIAQEVQQVLPELVHKDDKGFLAVAEAPLVALLIEEVKSLRQRVAALEAR